MAVPILNLCFGENLIIELQQLRTFFAKTLAPNRLFQHSSAVPVKYEAEKVYSSTGTPRFDPCGVLNRDGIFYASLKMQGQERPLEVALHGIASEIEARLALATLSMLRGADCSLAKP